MGLECVVVDMVVNEDDCKTMPVAGQGVSAVKRCDVDIVCCCVIEWDARKLSDCTSGWRDMSEVSQND